MEFYSKIFGLPCEVGVEFWKIGIAGKLCSILPPLFGISFSKPGKQIQKWLPQASQYQCLSCLYSTLLQLSVHDEHALSK